MNDLAIDPLTNGRLADGEAILEQALTASRAAGASGAGVISMNLAMISIQRGFPDRAEPRLRESIETFRRSKSRRLGVAVLSLAQALSELGRREEARRSLDEAFDLLHAAGDDGALSHALRTRGDDELRAGRLEPAEQTAAELEAQAKRSGDRLPLGLSNRLRGEIAAASGDFPEAQRRFGEARRQFLENADRDEAADLDVVWAEAAFRFGELTVADECARRVRPDPSAAIESNSQFLAEVTLIRIDARAGRGATSAPSLATLEAIAAGSTSVRRQLGLLRAGAAVAAAAGDVNAARRDLKSASFLARRAGSPTEALELERELAANPGTR
ncbi:MAG: hypothetical protein ABIV06_02220 [Thermoanaerobaculia bacterium]